VKSEESVKSAYPNNPFFYAKIGLFVIIGLASLYPTFTFLFWFKGFQNGEIPP